MMMLGLQARSGFLEFGPIARGRIGPTWEGQELGVSLVTQPVLWLKEQEVCHVSGSA